MSFRRWLTEQEGRADAIGSFAVDAKISRAFPECSVREEIRDHLLVELPWTVSAFEEAWEEWQKDRGVYFIQAGEIGPIKIGYAGSVRRRLADLQVANHELLHLIAVFRLATISDEKRLHPELAAHRIRGEWFHPHDDVFAAIDRLFAG